MTSNSFGGNPYERKATRPRLIESSISRDRTIELLNSKLRKETFDSPESLLRYNSTIRTLIEEIKVAELS